MRVRSERLAPQLVARLKAESALRLATDPTLPMAPRGHSVLRTKTSSTQIRRSYLQTEARRRGVGRPPRHTHGERVRVWAHGGRRVGTHRMACTWIGARMSRAHLYPRGSRIALRDGRMLRVAEHQKLFSIVKALTHHRSKGHAFIMVSSAPSTSTEA